MAMMQLNRPTRYGPVVVAEKDRDQSNLNEVNTGTLTNSIDGSGELIRHNLSRKSLSFLRPTLPITRTESLLTAESTISL